MERSPTIEVSRTKNNEIEFSSDAGRRNQMMNILRMSCEHIDASGEDGSIGKTTFTAKTYECNLD